MEVDETDNTAPPKAPEEKEVKPTEEPEPEKPEPDVEMKEPSKPENTDTSSQDTDSDAKSQVTEPSDEQPNETADNTELNGETVESSTKTEQLIPTANPLTTTA